MKGLAITLLAIPGSGIACVLGLHVGTYHFDREKERNEFNPGAMAMCSGYTAGAYLNSLNKPSLYAGYTLEHGPFGITAGAVTGYGHLAPMVTASVRMGYGFRLAVFPPHNHKSGGLHLIKEFDL